MRWSKPRIFELSNEKHREELGQLRKDGRIESEIDHIKTALSELYDIHNPSEKDRRDESNFEAFVNEIAVPSLEEYGSWVYFEWSKLLIHFPSKKDLLALLTSRNRNLINEEEQKKLSEAVVFVAGMSVGSNVVESLVRQQIGGKLIIADFDVLEPTNLNRIQASFDSVGELKTDVVAKKVSLLNPYIEIVKYDKGVDTKSLAEIVDSHQPSVIIDEIDSVEVKFEIRSIAQKFRIPVVMATDNGDGAILDIDDFQKDPNAPHFGGRIPNNVIEQFKAGDIPREQAGALIGKYFVGEELVSKRMLESLSEVRKSIPSWPQLGSAAALSGILVAGATKRIILGEALAKNRYTVSLEDILI